jgi:hypothetical protein
MGIVLEFLYVAIALVGKLDTCGRTLDLEYIEEEETGPEYAKWVNHRRTPSNTANLYSTVAKSLVMVSFVLLCQNERPIVQSTMHCHQLS